MKKIFSSLLFIGLFLLSCSPGFFKAKYDCEARAKIDCDLFSVHCETDYYHFFENKYVNSIWIIGSIRIVNNSADTIPIFFRDFKLHLNDSTVLSAYFPSYSSMLGTKIMPFDSQSIDLYWATDSPNVEINPEQFRFEYNCEYGWERNIPDGTER
ncbi:MAG: hypothetical protein KAH48_01705 [Chlorobi bacterium]|nr:hypothetical protein [Chlorobiota bacterium]